MTIHTLSRGVDDEVYVLGFTKPDDDIITNTEGRKLKFDDLELNQEVIITLQGEPVSAMVKHLDSDTAKVQTLN